MDEERAFLMCLLGTLHILFPCLFPCLFLCLFGSLQYLLLNILILLSLTIQRWDGRTTARGRFRHDPKGLAMLVAMLAENELHASVKLLARHLERCCSGCWILAQQGCGTARANA